MKKPTAIQISIPEPCTQAWGEMQPVQGGRHCTHCQKVVVDFTRMTDAQLLDYFRKNSIGCGQFRNEQLGVSIKSITVAKQNWIARTTATMLFIIGLSKMVEAQVKKGRPQIVQKNNNKKTATSVKRLKEVTVKVTYYQPPIIDPEEPMVSVTTGQVYYKSEPDASYKKMPVTTNEYLLKNPANATECLTKADHLKRSFWERIQFWRK